MKKSLEEKREARIKEIADLIKKRDETNARLDFLMGITGSNGRSASESALPKEFPLMKEIEALFKENRQLRILQATSLIQKKFPQYMIERRKVHSVLVYLAKKGIIKKEEERGLFSLIDK